MNEPPTTTVEPSSGTPPALLTLEEVRAVLRISRWSIYQLINHRRLKTVRIGQRRLVTVDDLRALIEELRREGNAYGD
jgi:excisionase family DNA binding protein